MKLLRKLMIIIILLIIITSISIGDLVLIKSYISTNDLMMAKVTDQLSLRITLAEEKYVKYQQFKNWVVAITTNESDWNVTALNLSNIVIIAILVIVITSLVRDRVISRLIIKPIRTLGNSMSKGTDVDMTHHVEVRTKDEIEQLGKSYNITSENQKEILISYIYFSGLIASADKLTSLVARVTIK